MSSAPGETVHNDDPAASVWVAPESFEVPGRGIVRVRVRVEPTRPGRIRDALMFRAENRDGDAAHACVYVRGAVERAPEVRVRSAAVVAPEAACAGMPAWYAVNFRMAAARGPFRVRRTRYEFDGGSTLSPRPGSVVQTYENGSASRAALELQAPIGTEVSGVTELLGRLFRFYVFYYRDANVLGGPTCVFHQATRAQGVQKILLR